MRFDEILEQVAHREDRTPPGSMVVPSSENIAFHVRFSRALLQLKREGLANLAGVSVSTIERVERAEKASTTSLNKIATAFGLDSGFYTSPRARLSQDEALSHFVSKYGEMEAVAVASLRKQLQVRDLARCQSYLVNRAQLDDSFDDVIESLTEWIDLASFLLSDVYQNDNSTKVRRRELYQSILEAVAEIENRGVTVLAGVMLAPLPGIPDWKVAVLSMTRKELDPGAIKRRAILVDRRCIQFGNIENELNG